MLSLLKGHVSEAAAPLIFGVLFLVIVGGALWVTPRLAKWLEKKESGNKSYYDGMLTEDPNGGGDDRQEDEDGKTGGHA